MGIFERPSDYEYFLELVRRSARNFSVSVHGFALMTTHYHLIVTPASEHGLPKMMKAVDGGYVRYYNQRVAAHVKPRKSGPPSMSVLAS